MYRPSTPGEFRAIGVPYRVVGSPWYRSSNTRCVYPNLDDAGYDHEEAKRQVASRYDRALGTPQNFPLTGDGSHAEALTGGIAHERDPNLIRYLHGRKLRIALAEARWKDAIDARIATRRETMSDDKYEKTLEAILIDEGFVANRYLLEINHTLAAGEEDRTEAPWNLPSRVMERPVECNIGEDGLVHVGLMQPALADHPFVKRLAEVIKPYRIGKAGAPTAGGYTLQHSYAWFHAVDMLRTRPWQELIETRRFTTSAAIIRAVAYALDYPVAHFGIAEAKELLGAMKVKPPKDAASVVRCLVTPDSLGYINVIPSTEQDWEALSWLWIWAIDAQWFAYDRRKKLVWTYHGVEMHEAVTKMQEAA